MSAAPLAVNGALLRRWPLPAPRSADGKDERGMVLIVAGSQLVAGAAILAAVAALRAGAGRLQIATAAGVAPSMSIAVPEAMVRGLPVDRHGEIARVDAPLLAAAAQADAVLVGPGMRASRAARALVHALMDAGPAPMVLDAGALPASARPRGAPVLLTPHAGEMARLLGLERDEVRAAPLAMARRCAAERDVLVALKGESTWMASPDGRAWRHRGVLPGLGTSGSGDVLAGLVAGLLARGAEPAQALVWAVWLHARAARSLVTRHGKLGFLARELAGEVPRWLGA